MVPDILETMGVHGFITYYIFIIALGMGFLLLCLTLWHGRLISRGETSVERLLDKNYIHQYYEHGFIFVKLYDNNKITNWKRFLGVHNIGEFIRRILLPSTHKPEGNGITMDNYEVHTNLLLKKKDSDDSKQCIPDRSNGYHSVSGGYLINKYGFESSSSQTQTLSNSFSPYYKPQISLPDRKNNGYTNKIWSNEKKNLVFRQFSV